MLVGDVSFQSAGYVARYSLKKVNGDLAAAHYRRVDPDTGEVFDLVPEFAHMSLKPGIGASWFDRFYGDFRRGRLLSTVSKARRLRTTTSCLNAVRRCVLKMSR